MSDIAKCQDNKCPSRLMCYRFTAPANEYRQSYGLFNREEDANNCNMFWGNKHENILNQLKDIVNGKED
jgi:hypothetical protein